MTQQVLQQALEALIGCVEHMEHSTQQGRTAYQAASAVIESMQALEQQPCGYDETTGNCTSNPCCRRAEALAQQGEQQTNTSIQGLSAYLRCEAGGVFVGHPSHETLIQWASAVDALAQQGEPAPLVPQEWTNLLAYVLQDDMHNRLTPRVVDIAYTAFMLAKQPNVEDGGESDWFNDTKPTVTELIAKLKKDLVDEFAAKQALAQQGEPVAGWKLVPVEPTPQMLAALWAYKQDNLADCYRAMLASAPAAQQGEQHPVAWKHSCNALCVDGLELWIDACPHCGKPRNAGAAPAAQPLTDEQIKEIWVEHGSEGEDAEGFARAIERAHGIGAAPAAQPHARDAVTWTPETGYVFSAPAAQPQRDCSTCKFSSAGKDSAVVLVYEETCFSCCQYYGDLWEVKQ